MSLILPTLALGPGSCVILGSNQDDRHRAILEKASAMEKFDEIKVSAMDKFDEIILIAPAGIEVQGLEPTTRWEPNATTSQKLEILRQNPNEKKILVVIDYQRADDNQDYLDMINSQEFSCLFTQCRHFNVTMILAVSQKKPLQDVPRPLGFENTALIPPWIRANARELVVLDYITKVDTCTREC